MMDKNLTNKYCLNPSSFIVKGYTRSMVFDSERSTYFLIPNILVEILEDTDCQTIEGVLAKYADADSPEHKEIILSYFNKLVEKEVIFFTEFPEYYKKIVADWDYPGQVSNAIIDIDSNSNFSLNKIFIELGKLGCRNIQLRSYSIFDHQKIKDLLSCIKRTAIESIQFIIPFINEKEYENLISLAHLFPRIKFIQIYNASNNKIIYASADESVNIVAITNELKNEKCCGVISSDYFSTAFYTFAESQNFNSCLNRKISIDRYGNIKNCPSLSTSYGNIKNTTLQKTLDNIEFKKIWNINKEKINICNVCEFRHVCTDCRAYLKNPNDIYSKPLKCGYDPKTGEWSDWSIDPSLRDTIQYYEL